VLVRDGDRTIRLASGFSTRTPRTPMRVSDRFRIGSVTKTFVSTLVLQLVGERKLMLTDTVEHWLPGLVPNGDKITVRELLNHTSGLAEYDDAALEAKITSRPMKAWTPRQLIAHATAKNPDFAPGTKWSYSNTGYALAGLIVEKATGHSLRTELQQRIFGPLGLRGTSYDSSPRIAGQHAHGYGLVGKPPAKDVSILSPTWAGAAGAIVSTADDVARFERALLQGRLPGPPPRDAGHRPNGLPPQRLRTWPLEDRYPGDHAGVPASLRRCLGTQRRLHRLPHKRLQQQGWQPPASRIGEHRRALAAVPRCARTAR
jgi:D-alanyl-D-alanine carboxypeptidase